MMSPQDWQPGDGWVYVKIAIAATFLVLLLSAFVQAIRQ